MLKQLALLINYSLLKSKSVIIDSSYNKKNNNVNVNVIIIIVIIIYLLLIKKNQEFNIIIKRLR